MNLFRFKKRQLSRRAPIARQRWDMRPKRTRILRIQQLLKGRVLVAFAILLVVSGSIYAFFFTNVLAIKGVEVSTVYKDINVGNLEKSIGEVVKGKNLMLVRMEEVEKVIYEQFPDVSSIGCGRNFFRRIFECDALGYELIAVMKHEGNRYYLNENGVVISYDGRKLGLPIFDLILNPVFAEIPKKTTTVPEPQPVLNPALPPDKVPAESLTASIVSDRQDGSLIATAPAAAAPETTASPDTSLLFIQPDQVRPIEPLVINEDRKVFEVAVGQKIVDPAELKTILQSIKDFEDILQRKVIEVQYVQVAGELSLKSKPSQAKEESTAEGSEKTPPAPVSEEDPEHDFIVLFDLRRNLEDQFDKLGKTKEVIDFSQVKKIDLSIDGEKVFYR